MAGRRNDRGIARAVGRPRRWKMTSSKELDDVVLTCDLPAHGLERGDIGTVLLVQQASNGYEVEFSTLDGESIAIVTLTAIQFRPCKPREIAHVRELAANP